MKSVFSLQAVVGCSPFQPTQVHILNESRGSTLEVVISRMKLRGSSVRFILVSATVPNIEDVADWIGIGGSSERRSRGARVYEVRPTLSSVFF